MPVSRYIYLSIGQVSDINGDQVETLEAYKLSIFITGLFVQITGNNQAGLFYGVQSLLSLEDGVGWVPDVVIVDYPRFGYRGVQNINIAFFAF